MSDDITQANAEVSAKDSTPRLQVNHLSVAFHTDEGRVPAVSDVSFSIAPGRITALLGESGSGKSVTSLALMRLLPGSTHQTGSRQTVTGSARFVARDGRAVDLLSLPEARMRALRGNQIAMVFQEPMSCPNPVFTVGKHLKRYFGDAKRPGLNTCVQ